MNKKYFGYLLTLVAMVAGVVTGWVDFSFLHESATVVSDLFLRLLRLISLPIIFLSIASTISGMKSFHEMRNMGRRVLTYTLGTTFLAATVALLLFIFIDPASGHATALVQSGGTEVVAKQGSYLSFAMNIIPSNFFQAFVESNVIGIAFIAFLLSLASLGLPKEQKDFVHKLFSSLFALVLKVTRVIITLMPLAIWAFVTLLVRDLLQNYDHFNQLMLYLVCIIGANVIQGVVVLPIMLKLKGVSPLKTFKGMSKALTVAFFTKSSNATLPVALNSAENNLKVSPKVSNFSMPLCSVINMNGCAAFILISVLFVSTLHGIAFTGLELVAWIFFASIAAVGNAGVPMGCFFLASAFLIGMDVPLYMMGLILPFYTILDMIETALNVWSDSCITVVVDKELKAQEARTPIPIKEIDPSE